MAYVQAQLGHEDPSMTLGVYARAVRSGRRTVRSRRRLEAFEAGTNGHQAVEDVFATLDAEAA